MDPWLNPAAAFAPLAASASLWEAAWPLALSFSSAVAACLAIKFGPASIRFPLAACCSACSGAFVWAAIHGFPDLWLQATLAICPVIMCAAKLQNQPASMKSILLDEDGDCQ